MSTATGDGTAIAAFLADLGRALPAGPRRRRILAEVGAHLEDGAQAGRDAGLAPPDAERRAVERFGPAHEIARGFAGEMAGEGARSATAVAALALAGMVGLWIVMGSVARTPPWPGATWPDELRSPLLVTWGAFAAALLAIGLSALLYRVGRPRAAVGAAIGAMGAIAVSTAACLVMAANGEYVHADAVVAAIAGIRVALTLAAAGLVGRAAIRVAGGLRRTPC